MSTSQVCERTGVKFTGSARSTARRWHKVVPAQPQSRRRANPESLHPATCGPRGAHNERTRTRSRGRRTQRTTIPSTSADPTWSATDRRLRGCQGGHCRPSAVRRRRGSRVGIRNRTPQRHVRCRLLESAESSRSGRPAQSGPADARPGEHGAPSLCTALTRRLVGTQPFCASRPLGAATDQTDPYRRSSSRCQPRRRVPAAADAARHAGACRAPNGRAASRRPSVGSAGGGDEFSGREDSGINLGDDVQRRRIFVRSSSGGRRSVPIRRDATVGLDGRMETSPAPRVPSPALETGGRDGTRRTR